MMKSTGIVRRIDDLGRVVIPREIRRTLKIKDGDALELFTTEDGVCFRKYEADLHQMEERFGAIFSALYKMEMPVGLYADGNILRGHPSLPTSNRGLVHRTFGVWGNYEWSICYREENFAPFANDMRMECILSMATATMKEVAREIYGDD
jgi:AbrB family looped-hinge helix DNA binding protein